MNNDPANFDSKNQPWQGSSRRRLSISLLLCYVSIGFLLTFALRWQWIMPAPGTSDFLDALFNSRIYLSALTWPYWLLQSCF